MVDENCWVVARLSTKFAPGSSVRMDQLNAGRKLAPVKQLCVTVEATVTVSPAKNFPSLRKLSGSSTSEMAGNVTVGAGVAQLTEMGSCWVSEPCFEPVTTTLMS